MKLHQDIAFCRAPDGTRIATASCGTGPVILRAAHWLSHVAYDLDSPVWLPWVEALSARHRYIRYDPRGCGMSERNCADLSLSAWHGDLDAVAARVAAPRFALLGLSQGGALAIDYAVRHPERVSHLVLLNAYAEGARARAGTDAERLEAETLVNFVRIGWGRENPAFCRFFTNLFIPDGTPEQHRWWGDLERETAAPEVAAEILWHMQGIDVAGLCPSVSRSRRWCWPAGATCGCRSSRVRGSAPPSPAPASCRSTAPITSCCRANRPGACFTGARGVPRRRCRSGTRSFAGPGGPDRRRGRGAAAPDRRTRQPLHRRQAGQERKDRAQPGLGSAVQARRQQPRAGDRARPGRIAPVAGHSPHDLSRRHGASASCAAAATLPHSSHRPWCRQRRDDRCHWTKPDWTKPG